MLKKPVWLDFRNFHYLVFPDFMFENLELISDSVI